MFDPPNVEMTHNQPWPTEKEGTKETELAIETGPGRSVLEAQLEILRAENEDLKLKLAESDQSDEIDKLKSELASKVLEASNYKELQRNFDQVSVS